MSKQEEKYLEYLHGHIENVQKAFEFLVNKIGGGSLELPSQVELQKQISKHDLSKFGQDELTPYALYFYGEKTDDVIKNFKEAVKLHKSRNPHHPEYWQNEKGFVENMPDQYILEMVCDWWAFSLAKKNPLEILEWYDRHKDETNFSHETRGKIEAILQIIKENGKEVEK